MLSILFECVSSVFGVPSGAFLLLLLPSLRHTGPHPACVISALFLSLCARRTTSHLCVIAVVALTVHGLHPITAIVCPVHQRSHAAADAVSEGAANAAEPPSALFSDRRSQYRVDSDAE